MTGALRKVDWIIGIAIVIVSFIVKFYRFWIVQRYDFEVTIGQRFYLIIHSSATMAI